MCQGSKSLTIQCKSNEKLIGEKCEKVYLVGDSCKDQPERCADNSICNKKGKCVCKCDTIPIGKECLPKNYGSTPETITNVRK